MEDGLTIGEIARQAALPASTIRYYEAEGILPPPGRSASGYRRYSEHDLRRIRLAKGARLLGLPLEEIRTLVAANDGDCGTLADELLEGIARRRQEVTERIAELRAVEAELDAVEQRVRAAACPPTMSAADCDCSCFPE
jgi:DNA-binding transcriptional MerR regulator